ncbi:hypothetical protein FISHEDRAFT_62807 [Fistulina hepatica ATCC 64428]|uniref:Zn(2)-C6 fungal-type domain-containing protein n=1 Tax=Fistulina hepatica ATCC 64428 TaxID=1128425 RepID=A0A0D7A2X0_9AGAR|nr:hypothetical protein FISHEDRAFT_62807 [Fistulina hepatica ATCC 64428]
MSAPANEASTSATSPSLSSPGPVSPSAPSVPSPPTLSRPFRSRKNRPCDACRRAKTRCAIPAIGPPCVECQQTRKQCTFDQLPPERKKTQKRLATPEFFQPVSHHPSVKRQRTDSPVLTGIDAPVHAAAQEKRLTTVNPSHNSQFKISLDLSTPDVLEPHVITALLTDDLLPVGTKHAGPEATGQLPDTNYIRQISCVSSKPQYIIFTHKTDKTSTYYANAQDELARLRAALRLLQPGQAPSETALIDLFFTQVNPAFPILLSREHQHPREREMSPHLIMTALSHIRQYRAAVGPIRRLVMQSRTPDNALIPRLFGISGAILTLSARPVPDAEMCYLALSRTIAQAQLMGLHIDPATWAIPEWEKDHRRVLWWCLRVHDAWMSFLNSRPSHIQLENTNVPIPALSALAAGSSAAPSPASDAAGSASPAAAGLQRGVSGAPNRSAQSFVYGCRLGLLVSRLQTQACTLTATLVVSREERLQRVQTLEQEARALLEEVRREWDIFPDRPPVQPQQTGVASVMTALLGFRCMLRRIAIELYIGLGSPFIPDVETLEIFADAVDFVCGLQPVDLDGFWLNYVSHILSSVTSSIIRLCLAMISATHHAGEGTGSTLQANARTCPFAQLSRLRNALHQAKYEQDWDLADAAIVRIESVASCLQNVKEYAGLISALQGRYQSDICDSRRAVVPVHGGESSEIINIGEINNTTWNVDLSGLGVGVGMGLDWTGLETMGANMQPNSQSVWIAQPHPQQHAQQVQQHMQQPSPQSSAGVYPS